MRDVELMIKSLEEMANRPGGLILVARTLGMSETQQTRIHNIDLLTDAGLAVWVTDSGVRITNDGYDFLNAVNQDRPRYVGMVKELLAQGKSLLAATSNVISIVNGLGAAGSPAV